MDNEQRSDAPAGPPARRFVAVIVVVVLGVTGGAAAWSLWRSSAGQERFPRRVAMRAEARRARSLDDDAATSPYANVRPGVRYVGDAACRACHEEIVESYRKHPMGRSLAPITAAPGSQNGGPGDHGSFQAGGFEYVVERRGDHLFHKEIRRDARGRVLTEAEAEIRYVIGSGSRTFSYLIDRDGYLFESPISWYSQARRWDLSPGYEKENPHFERAVTVVCLFCHANRTDSVAETLNRYRPPIFEGYAIGCERCHGPGELHVKQPLARAGDPPTIVNPSDLEPALREGVCQQCHLQGDIRVDRAGRTMRDYRPGLPLHHFESVFIKASNDPRKRFFGQVEQMYESRCFRASRGALGCTSCHDPHRQPSPEEKVAYYRERCLNCHAERGCGLPRSKRLERSAVDSCTECHMPRSSSAEVPHTATTIHNIPRFANRPEPAAGSADPEGPLIHFHRDLIVPEERAEVARDLAIALVLRAYQLPGMTPAEACQRALPLLEPALAARPDDVDAWWAKGDALRTLERRAEAVSAFQAALKSSPHNEAALEGVATLLAQMERRDEALDSWRRLLAIDPWHSAFHHYLALVHGQFDDWPSAAEACRTALKLNPADVSVRFVLVQSYLKMGRKPEARDEFMIILGYDPPNRDAMERWYAAQQ